MDTECTNMYVLFVKNKHFDKWRFNLQLYFHFILSLPECILKDNMNIEVFNTENPRSESIYNKGIPLVID